MKSNKFQCVFRGNHFIKATAYMLTIVLTISSCTTIPIVNANWITNNCQSVGYFAADSKQYSNCSRKADGTYNCTYEKGDRWEGKLLAGNQHGLGRYTWSETGGYFNGEMNNGSKWCGVEAQGTTFFVYRNGLSEQGTAGIDWEAVGAGLLIIGIIGAAAAAGAGGGGGGTYASDYDWDWDAFYDQYYNLQWRCRGIQTGQFAEDEKCLYDYKDDNRWPAK